MSKYYGELPKGKTLLAACDETYFQRFGEAFIQSAIAHGHHVHVHIVNPTRKYLSSGMVSYSWEKNAPTNREYYASARFFIAPHLMLHSPDLKLLILDIDSIVRSHITFPDAAVGLYLREPFGANEWEKRGTRVAAGIVYYDDTAWLFANRVAERIKSLPQQWFVDQISLAETLDEFVNAIKVHDFGTDYRFLDWEFRDDAFLWTAKGPTRKRDQRFLVEQSKYLNEG